MRQILSILDYPQLLDNPLTDQIFPSDVINRAKMILTDVPGGTGAYSQSQGLLSVRRQVASFIEQRDGGIHHHR